MDRTIVSRITYLVRYLLLFTLFLGLLLFGNLTPNMQTIALLGLLFTIIATYNFVLEPAEEALIQLIIRITADSVAFIVAIVLLLQLQLK